MNSEQEGSSNHDSDLIRIMYHTQYYKWDEPKKLEETVQK
jgi:hypothetical protein